MINLQCTPRASSSGRTGKREMVFASIVIEVQRHHTETQRPSVFVRRAIQVHLLLYMSGLNALCINGIHELTSVQRFATTKSNLSARRFRINLTFRNLFLHQINNS